MKKIFIVLSFFMIFTFTIFNNRKASAALTDYGTNMTYKTLNLWFDFEYQYYYQHVSGLYYVFEYQPVETSLEELIRAWGPSAENFMKLYTNVTIFQYLENTGTIPSDGDIGWTAEDGYIYLIITSEYVEEYSESIEDFITGHLWALEDAIKVDTWVITESTPDYQIGYNAGYSNGHQAGYQSGYSDGWNAKEAQFNLELPALLAAEFQEGYSAGRADGFNEGAIIGYDIGYEEGYDEGLQVSQGEAYDKGYQDGANESFIGTMDSWLVPAIIVVMLLGGYFAIARKKHDGDI